MTDRMGPRRPAVPATGRAPGRGGNRPAPSLVSATLLGSFRPCVDSETGEVLSGNVAVSVIEYPDGVELSAVPLGRPSERGGSGELREWQLRQEEEWRYGGSEAESRATAREEAKAQHSQDESVRRAKTRVRRVVRFYSLRYMVTLTFPGEGVHDYNRALRYVQDFIHDHGEVLHLGGCYLSVPELHPGGHGWHWHVLVHRRFSKAELKTLWIEWTAFLGRRGMHPSGGAEYVRIDVKRWGSSASAARYAAKYVGKSLEGTGLGKNRRRFLASQGAVVEAEKAYADSLDEVQEVAESIPGGYVIKTESEEGRPPIVWASWDL